MYIKRHIENKIIETAKDFKVVLITGSRQVGKSTTLKKIFAGKYNYVTLDDINYLTLAKNDPKFFFESFKLPIIIDEVQKAPELFSEIKRIVDDSNLYGQIILTGSHNFSLMAGVTETLAGRIGIIEFSGLSLRELNNEELSEPFFPTDDYLNKKSSELKEIDLWKTIHRGSYPELYKRADMSWMTFYASYVQTYIERDVRSIVNIKDLGSFANFLISAAARTGNLVNFNQIANEVGRDLKTIKSWFKILETSGLVVLIEPYSNNLLKRMVTTPVLYFLDTGLVSYLLKWNSKETLRDGAMSGAILETFVVAEIVKSYRNKGFLKLPISFYRDYDQSEIDLILEMDGILIPVEIKKTMNPKKEMAKTFKKLEKALGYEIGNEIILCLVDKRLKLGDKLYAYPIKNI